MAIQRTARIFLEQLLQCILEWRATYGNITLDELIKQVETQLKSE